MFQYHDCSYFVLKQLYIFSLSCVYIFAIVKVLNRPSSFTPARLCNHSSLMAHFSSPPANCSDSKPLNPHAEPFIQQTILWTSYNLPRQLVHCRTALSIFPMSTPPLSPVSSCPWVYGCSFQPQSEPYGLRPNSPFTSYSEGALQYSVSYETRIFKAEKVETKVKSLEGFEETKWEGKPPRKQKGTREKKRPMKVDIYGGDCSGFVPPPLSPYEGKVDGGDSGSTTIMIRNIPNQFRRRDILHILDEHCRSENGNDQSLSDPFRSEYDFVYLPMDFRRFWFQGKISNLGYAFVNFTTTNAASKFSEVYHNFPWEVPVNKKVCKISVAKLQGKEALEGAFKNKIFWCHSDQFLPVILSPASDGCRSYKPMIVGKRVATVPPKPIKRSSLANKGPSLAHESDLKSCDSM